MLMQTFCNSHGDSHVKKTGITPGSTMFILQNQRCYCRSISDSSTHLC